MVVRSWGRVLVISAAAAVPMRWLVVGLALLVAGRCLGEPFVMARSGVAAAVIVVAAEPCAASSEMANTLKTMLGRISGATFTVESGDGRNGIAVGLATEFPALAGDPAIGLAERFGATDLATQQSYVLRSHAKGVQLLGATELGVVYAAWDLLYRLGYRQFLPGADWEIIPHRADLTIEVDSFEKPDFILRYIAGTVPPEWCLKNRVSPVLGWQNAAALPYLPRIWTKSLAQCQHNWASIISFAEEEFKAHPEYYGLVTITPKAGTKPPPTADESVDEPTDLSDALGAPVAQPGAQQRRVSSKLCVSNPRVRELAGLYALDYFAKNPQAASVSMEPTDGSGWCECANCVAIGGPSERVALMANTVAEALEATYPEKYVGILAYHLHANPPKRKLHPRVVVSLATAMSGRTPIEERLADWAKVADCLGVHEYLSVMEWHIGLPTKSRVANVPFLCKQIPFYHDKNALFFSGQATGGAWGGHGFGYYMLSRLLWDSAEAGRVEALTDDFLTSAFGTAAAPMQRYWHVVDASQQRGGSAQFFMERATLMKAALREAWGSTDDPAVRKRIGYLALYAHYTELFARKGMAKGSDQWPTLCRFVRHAHRMRYANMVSFGVVTGYVKNAKKVELYPLLRQSPEEKLLKIKPQRDKSGDQPFTETEIAAILDGTYKETVPEAELPPR